MGGFTGGCGGGICGGCTIGVNDGATFGDGDDIGVAVGGVGVVEGKLEGVAAGACALVMDSGKQRQTKRQAHNSEAIFCGDGNWRGTICGYIL